MNADPPSPARRPRPARQQSHHGAVGLIALVAVSMAALTAMVMAFSGLAALTREGGGPPMPTPVVAATPMPTAPLVAQPAAGSPPTASAPPPPQPPPTATLIPPPPTVRAAAPTATVARPTARPSPSVAPTAVSAGPVGAAETIRLHYQLIDERRYDEGYRLMSARLRAQRSRATYESWFQNKVSVRAVSVALVSQDGGRAVVESVVDSADRVGGETVEQRVAERFVLVLEDGGWRIDQVTRL